jgi:Zn-dependent protease
MFRAPATFRAFEKLRGNRLVALLLDAGIVSTAVLAAYFYYIVARRVMLMLTAAQAGQPVLVPIIPGVTISIDTFIYMLPGLSLGIILHELMHALAARYEGINVKSAGFFIVLGLLPAAFVEPEEEELRSANLRAKLRVYSAGILANTLLALLFIALLAAASSGGTLILLTHVKDGSPADRAGLKPGMLVENVYINGSSCGGFNGFISCMARIATEYNGTENVALNVTFRLSDGSTVMVFKPRGVKMIGISFVPVPAKLATVMPPDTAYKVYAMLQLALAINLGLAAVNAVPLFITDGAQALRSVLERLSNPARANIATIAASMVTLALILPNLYIP